MNLFKLSAINNKMVNKLSSQEYIDIIYHNTILPLELCEKIISYIYTFTFKTKITAEKAIMEYQIVLNFLEIVIIGML